MSDEHLDDEAPPEIPDISDSEEGDKVPEKGAKPESDPGIEVDVEFEDRESEPEIVEPEVLDAALSEPSASPAPPPRRRERVQTNPATPIARASVPPPPGEEAEQPPPGSLKAPKAPKLDAIALSDEEVRSDVSSSVDDASPEPPRRGSIPPPRPASVPPPRMASAPPPRPVSQPPRPVSPPPRPVSQPPIHVIAEPPTAPDAAPRPASEPPVESEPPTQPRRAEDMPPAAAEQGDAATSYPPPPRRSAPPPPDEEKEVERDQPSLRPMRIISVSTEADAKGETPPTEPERAVESDEEVTPPPVPSPATPPPRAPALTLPDSPAVLADAAALKPEPDALDDGDITFPSDEREDAKDELTDADIAETADRDSAERISVEVELEDAMSPAKGPPPPPPPPRRESGKVAKPVTPPSVVEAKEAQRSKQRKAWWEELFGEDFARANARLKNAQITQEANFIEESLGVVKGGVVLDLACGGGQHAVEIAKRGYGVVGYDLSLYQLAVAADVAQDSGQKLNLLQGDMREMAFEEMFDGIYCWNTSFGYFEEEKNLAVAQRVFRALRPGGMFLLDVANRDFVVANQPSQTWFEGDACVCMDDMSVDFITSRLRVKRSLILDDGRTLECAYSIRLYGLHELGKVLHDVGFRVTEASGHPATPGVFFGASSPRIIILAQRP
jgi:SAM-dependent methyltransferase